MLQIYEFIFNDRTFTPSFLSILKTITSSFYRWQTLEMSRCEYLNEEDETEQNGHLVGSCEVGSKQAVRQRNDHEGRDELAQIEGG